MAGQPINKLDHVGIAVKNLDAARGFWENTMGAQFMYAGDNPDSNPYPLHFIQRYFVRSAVVELGGAGAGMVGHGGGLLQRAAVFEIGGDAGGAEAVVADLGCDASARGTEVVFRADAAFAKPEFYEALEERDVKYAIRLPANDNLQRNITELLTRPVGRPSHRPVVRFKSFLYQAASWTQARRVVAKVEFHCGELFPRVGFIVTNLAASSRAVVRFYNKRGPAEQWIKEAKQAAAMTRLSCHRSRANEVRLWLSLIAYNLGNLWRRLVLPARIGHWSLTNLQQRLVKTGGRLIKHARYYWLLLAESHTQAPPSNATLVMTTDVPRGLPGIEGDLEKTGVLAYFHKALEETTCSAISAWFPSDSIALLIRMGKASGLAALSIFIGTLARALPAAAAPLGFNLVIPLAEGEWSIRNQVAFGRASGDPVSNRQLTRIKGLTVLAYGMTRNLALFVGVPLIEHSSLNLNDNQGRRISRGSNGFGDLQAVGRYTLLESDWSGGTFRLQPFAGLDLPTGSYTRADQFGRLPFRLQPGSGTWDPLVGAVGVWQTFGWRFDNSAGYQFGLENHHYSPGDAVFVASTVRYRLWPFELSEDAPGFLYGLLKSRVTWGDMHSTYGVVMRNSGGISWSLGPGLQYDARRFVVETYALLPAVESLNGARRIYSDYAIVTNLRFNFFAPI